MSADLGPSAASELRRLFLFAAATLAVHQAQELAVAREAIPWRSAALLALGAGAVGASRLPARALGGVALALGVGPTFGAFAGHLVPLARDSRVTPASETAPFNLGGGVLMLVLGVALLRRPSGD